MWEHGESLGHDYCWGRKISSFKENLCLCRSLCHDSEYKRGKSSDLRIFQHSGRWWLWVDLGCLPQICKVYHSLEEPPRELTWLTASLTKTRYNHTQFWPFFFAPCPVSLASPHPWGFPSLFSKHDRNLAGALKEKKKPKTQPQKQLFPTPKPSGLVTPHPFRLLFWGISPGPCARVGVGPSCPGCCWRVKKVKLHP